MNGKTNDAKYDYVNSKALFVLKIITMSFAILAFVVITTAMLTKWITDLNRSIKESHSKIARATARLNRFRKARIKHILKQRKMQLKSERAARKNGKGKRKGGNCEYDGEDMEDMDEIEDMDALEDLTDEEKAIDNFDNFDNELRDIMIETADEEI